ncbi:MAG: PRC-barrel domain-containing protein [Halobacteriota archaeon]
MKAGIISAEKLSYKVVMDSEGRDLGVLHNIIVDGTTGMLTELVIKPASELDTSRFKREDEYIYIAVDALRSIKDVIIVDKEKIQERA